MFKHSIDPLENHIRRVSAHGILAVGRVDAELCGVGMADFDASSIQFDHSRWLFVVLGLEIAEFETGLLRLELAVPSFIRCIVLPGLY